MCEHYTDELDRVEQVEQTWPVDGPHSSDSLTEAAQAISALVRYLNHGTQSSALRYGPTLYRIAGGLASATGSLDQLLLQLRDAARRIGGDTTLYDDRRDRPGAATADRVAAHLEAARNHADALWDEILAACSLASHLGHGL